VSSALLASTALPNVSRVHGAGATRRAAVTAVIRAGGTTGAGDESAAGVDDGAGGNVDGSGGSVMCMRWSQPEHSKPGRRTPGARVRPSSHSQPFGVARMRRVCSDEQVGHARYTRCVKRRTSTAGRDGAGAAGGSSKDTVFVARDAAAAIAEGAA
jgi:hypothetical protein